MDSSGNGSVSSPTGTNLLSISPGIARVHDAVTGAVVCNIPRNENGNTDPQEMAASSSSHDLVWKFDGLVVEFLPDSWDLRVLIRNGRAECEFSSISGGRLLKVIDTIPNSSKATIALSRQEALISYNHESVRSELAAVVSRLDSMTVQLKNK